MTSDIRMPSDEQLTAFLDGELPQQEMARIEALANEDEEVAARIEFLANGSMPFREAFAPLLDEAPKDRLEAMLAAIPAPAAAAKTERSAITRRGLFGALAASLERHEPLRRSLTESPVVRSILNHDSVVRIG